VESNVRITVQTKRIRPSEFFLDYDRLRSGYVTETQFFRVLWENLGIKLTDEQQRSLAEKYGFRRDGRMNYRHFCETIDQPFNPNNLKLDPKQQSNPVPEFLGTTRSLRPLSPSKEARLGQLLFSLQKFYKYRGINLRTCCEDFDRHHIGVIQESQFFRSFPRPPEVSDDDVAILVQKYRDPDRPGLLNYLNLHHDLQALGELETQMELPLPKQTEIGNFLPQMPGTDSTLQAVFDRIRVAVFKNRVRTIEFFKDYDKLRSGIITENQFICGISLAIGKEAQLTRSEIQKIVAFYKLADGRVQYKEFCDMMENAFNIPDLEKRPTQDVVRPPQGALARNLPQLDDQREARIREVLEQLSDQVRKRRLMVYQYFKDYDRSKGYSRVITPTQFGRILHFLTLNVAAEDFKLLCKKFKDEATGDVNYPAFVQTVDREFVNYTQSEPMEVGSQASRSPSPTEKPMNLTGVNIEDIMARIRHIVLVHRRRVCEYFQDFDPLRSGSITKSQFQRGLSDLGFSALGHHNLSNAQFEALCQVYASPSQKDKIFWTHFMDDIESVFTQKGLEKNPMQTVAPPEIFLIPKPGTVDWSASNPDKHGTFLQVMDRLRARTSQRRVLVKPLFQDFDRHNNGHVTKSQLRQCLTMLELNCSEDEMICLEEKFCNDTGFNYISFLQELQPVEPPKMMYVQRLEDIRRANQKPKLPEKGAATDLESVLLKIKTKVFKDRIRIHEWMTDYDKLRTGRMKKSNFRRALDLCMFLLTESELAILEDHYQAVGYPDFVNYTDFIDEIESIFTIKNLDKAPLLEPELFKLPTNPAMTTLTPEMEGIVMKCMERLAEEVRRDRVQLFPLFEDYDKVHNGTVSRSQFRRVLSELALASLVATEQEWVCLWEKFDIKVGGKDDVNYIAFCDMIYDMAHFEWRKP